MSSHSGQLGLAAYRVAQGVQHCPSACTEPARVMCGGCSSSTARRGRCVCGRFVAVGCRIGNRLLWCLQHTCLPGVSTSQWHRQGGMLACVVAALLASAVVETETEGRRADLLCVVRGALLALRMVATRLSRCAAARPWTGRSVHCCVWGLFPFPPTRPAECSSVPLGGGRCFDEFQANQPQSATQ